MAEKSGATRRRFYTATEVTNHNSENDCWVSIFHKVYDLTEFLSFNKGESELRIDAGTPRGAQLHAKRTATRHAYARRSQPRRSPHTTTHGPRVYPCMGWWRVCHSGPVDPRAAFLPTH